MLHVLSSQHSLGLDSLVYLNKNRCILVDPSLNNERIVEFIASQKTDLKIEIWLSSSDVRCALYVNSLSDELQAAVYAPYAYLAHYLSFPLKGSSLGFCGVYQPKVKSDLKKRIELQYPNLTVKAFKDHAALVFEHEKKIWVQEALLCKSQLKHMHAFLKQSAYSLMV